MLEKQAESQLKEHKEPNRVERIERHLGSLHDYVRVMDSRLKELEFLNEKQEAIKKATANAKYRNKPKENNKQWQEQEAMQDAAPLQPAGQHPLVVFRQLAEKRLSVVGSAGLSGQLVAMQREAQEGHYKALSQAESLEQSQAESLESPGALPQDKTPQQQAKAEVKNSMPTDNQSKENMVLSTAEPEKL